ncbi:enoyl-CoA hydratase/isomerase family protein [Seongchinamella unica]|uniref:Enoyl-CoA hydratase/isomerase family protein n=1 Tax=Seongchinamella unica TaxID=2547392 RepID=A0A4R5LMP0_9GAMM|nr:enoyl-CoA hydratase/isomerase family protein [Seongchinamella unica]TDG11303.1 enoyl-CoA hydratase/isomerase family protein [Seongchinamella unica]
MQLPYLLKVAGDCLGDDDWLAKQPCPVIAIGSGVDRQADVVLPDESAAAALIAAIENSPTAALVLVQVLRAVEGMPVPHAMTLESLAFGLLQTGPEYQRWLTERSKPPALVVEGEGEAIEITREGSVLRARMNRPVQRNSLSVEMRDALVELLDLVRVDDTITCLELSAAGACFSVGGELREFGLMPSATQAHLLRSVHNPSRLIAAVADRVHCHLHGACMGSGIEIPAFAAKVTADRRTFFQLPELRFGLIPGAGGCVSISRRIGRQRTAWMALSGRKINSRTALAWGLVDAISE